MDTYWKLSFREKMREKKMTFPMLAKQLNLSLPGTKKIFQKTDISLERFSQICLILGLNPSEVIRGGLKDNFKVKRLSEAADKFLSEDQTAFKLFWKLTVDRIEAEEAMEELRISKKELYRILSELDRHKLVVWEKGDRVIVPDRVPFFFDPGLKCSMKFAKTEAQTLVEELFDPHRPTTTPVVLRMRQLALSEMSAAEVARILEAVVEELSKKNPYYGRKVTREQNAVEARLLVCFTPSGI